MLDSPVKQLIYAGHEMREGNKAYMQYLVVLIVTEKFTLYRSLDKGKQWSVVPLKGKNGKVQSILLSPSMIYLYSLIVHCKERNLFLR